MEEETAAFSDSWAKLRLRLPDKFAKLLDGGQPREVTLREAGGGRHLWNVEAVFDGEGHMYLERGWEQFARAHDDLEQGHFLVVRYDGNAVLTVKVFDLSMCPRHYHPDDDASSTGSSSDGVSDNSSERVSDKSIDSGSGSWAEMEEETAAFPDLSDFEFVEIIFENSWDRLRLPDKFAELLHGQEPREVKLREAGGGRRLWDVEVVFDGEGHVYVERGWEQFARAHDLGLGDVLVFSYDGDAVLTVKVFGVSMCGGNHQHDDADTGSNNSIDSSSSSAEIDTQFTGMRQQQQYPRMRGKPWPVNLILLATLAALICCAAATPVAAPPRGGPYGAWEQISNLNDPEVLEMARWALDEHDRQTNDGLQFERVVSGMTQIVAGVNYNLSIDAVNDRGQQCVYVAWVYDVPWLHTRTLESFRLGPSSSMAVCRLADHPAPLPNSRAPQISLSLPVLLSSCALFLFGSLF